jgi:hypothetical protein
MKIGAVFIPSDCGWNGCCTLENLPELPNHRLILDWKRQVSELHGYDGYLVSVACLNNPINSCSGDCMATLCAEHTSTCPTCGKPFCSREVGTHDPCWRNGEDADDVGESGRGAMVAVRFGPVLKKVCGERG